MNKIPSTRDYKYISEAYELLLNKENLNKTEYGVLIKELNNLPIDTQKLINHITKQIEDYKFKFSFKDIQELKVKLISEAKAKEEVPAECLEILKRPNLFNEITETEFNKKIVGELQSRKVIFLCANGRLVENHQTASYNLLVNDDAGIGKDYVTGCVLEILPKNVYIHKTRISPTVFTYWHNPEFEPTWTWDGKVFYPEDISEVVLNSDVFKVMTSKGSSATVVIRQRAVEIDVKGKPVMITTTATATPNPELTRRFVILNLDSSQEQTKAIMRRHSEFKEKGIVPEYDLRYRGAMSHLKRVKVKIPFAKMIDEHFPPKNIIMRTHYPRFLDFISASTAFYQYQRETDQEGFILATGQDYDIARECFLKLCSNKYMIPLTINQKKILEIFEKEKDYKFSVTQFHAKYNFMSLPALTTNFGLLAKYGLLETNTVKDTWNRDLEVYSLAQSYNPNKKIEIPTYLELLYRNSLTPLTPNIPLTSLIPLIPTQYLRGTKGIKGIKAELYNNNSAKTPKEHLFKLLESNKEQGIAIQDFVYNMNLLGHKTQDIDILIEDLKKKGEVYEVKAGFIKKM